MLHEPVRYKCKIFYYAYDQHHCVNLCGERVIFLWKAYTPIFRTDHYLNEKNEDVFGDRKVYLRVDTSPTLLHKIVSSKSIC